MTIPHKEAVLPWLGEIDSQAQCIGVVNTNVNCAVAVQRCLAWKGLSILLHQEMLALELWTGQGVPEEVMRATLDP